ncbi:MAG: ketopantoate reductase family protein [Myxococcota bacterium]
MRILVLGAGAIGGYFGGRLVEAGVDVTFLVRERRAEQLTRHGLVIESPVGNTKLSVKAVTSADGGYDAVILTCKAYDLAGAVDAIAPAVGPRTVVLPLLNGMRHLEVLDQRFGEARVLGGLCHIGVTMADDGSIRHLSAPAFFAVGPRLPEQLEIAKALHALLARGGFKPLYSDVILQEMWEKFYFIAAYAGLTCLMRAPIGAIMEARDGEHLALRLMDETAAVAKASGYTPREDFVRRSVRTITEKGSPATSSMLRDVLRGARTEHDHVIDDMLTRAEALRLDTPILRVVSAHLQAYEANRSRA